MKAQNPFFNVPFQTTTGVGMLPAVVSPLNRQADFAQVFTRQDGKTPIAKYKYKQRKLRSIVKKSSVNGNPNYCAATDTPLYLEAEKRIQKDIYMQFRIPHQDVRGYEESFARVLSDEIAASINAPLTELNALLIAEYEAVRGAFKGGSTTPKSYQGFSSAATYTVNHAFEHGVYDDFRALDYRGQKIIVGDQLVNAYFRTLMKGADNTERGQVNNMDVVRDFSFYDDTMLAAELSDSNPALIWRPGSFQMLEWFQNQGDFRIIKDTVINDTIDLNLGGVILRFDIFMRENFCDDASSGLDVTVRKHYDTWAFPSDIWNASDPLASTNGLLRFTMTAGA